MGPTGIGAVGHQETTDVGKAQWGDYRGEGERGMMEEKG